MSETLGQALQRVRIKLGFLSARSFYLDLSKRATLSFNYSYYMKIEADSLIPSEKVVAQLSALLPGSNGDEVVASYCQALFPEQMKRLLKNSFETSQNEPDKKILPKKSKPKALRSFQMELTERQVALIAESKDSYFLFLIFTLARNGIQKKDLKKYSFDKLDEALKNLITAKLIYLEDENFFATYPEFVFPKADTKSIQELYQKLNQYDLERNKYFSLNKIKRASFFKRVSPRQAEILLMHLELIFQTIRTADEQEVSYNTEVLSFELSYHQGKIIG